jgi:TnpA family transposase
MRLMQVLPDYESKRFNRVPVLSEADRKTYFKLDPSLKTLLQQAKEPHNQIGLWLSYVYFKVSGRFYSQKQFRTYDLQMIAKLLGISLPADFATQYNDRTRQRHRLLILEHCGCTEFAQAGDLFENIIQDLVVSQMHPRKLFYVLVETLQHKKIEVPSYDRIARSITQKFNAFEKAALQTITQTLTPSQAEALEQLLATPEAEYQRPLLTRLKVFTQSLRPAQIKHGMHNFLIIKKLFNELNPVVDSLALSVEATKYYAQWVIKAKVSQLSEIVEPHKRYLYLLAFVDHAYKIWQDTLVDMLLKCVQQQLNKVEQELGYLLKAKLSEKNKLVNTVLVGFQDNHATLEKVRQILHDKSLANNEKISQLCLLVPEQSDAIQAINDAKKLKEHLTHEESQGDAFGILTNLSRKLQNRVADLVRYLTFTSEHANDPLYLALKHYQTEKYLTADAPQAFLSDDEQKAVNKDTKFNVSLYKALLFCKVANAVKSGQINLARSYRYLSIDAYLMSESEWQASKQELLAKLGLAAFADIEALLKQLHKHLSQQYLEVNQRIISKENRYVTLKKDGTFTLYTPPVAKPDYESIATIIGKNRYVPLLQMMAEMDIITQFTSHFKHYKVKDAKTKPDLATFYAGIFALGTGMSLHKLANTAIGLNFYTLDNTVNWYFSLDNLHMVNQALIAIMHKLSLPNHFRCEKQLLHTSSDGQKQCVSVESLNANYSYKYHGNSKGVSVYRFIDERGILFYATVFTSSDRDAIYVIDGLLHNACIRSDVHSTDTHGYTEMVFAITHLMEVTFAPRIKDIAGVSLVSFEKMPSKVANKQKNPQVPLHPDHYVKEEKITKHWDTILRLCATMMLRRHRASTILKRLSTYANQHPLQEALKEFGRIIKTIFVLKYIDDVTWRQTIEKQLNKGELANKFAAAVSFANQEMSEAYQEDQEIAAMCKTILQNIIILWNYIELTKTIMQLDKIEREALLQNILNASIITWQHVNMYGIYDFSNLVAVNDNIYTQEEIINYKVA